MPNLRGVNAVCALNDLVSGDARHWSGCFALYMMGLAERDASKRTDVRWPDLMGRNQTNKRNVTAPRMNLPHWDSDRRRPTRSFDSRSADLKVRERPSGDCTTSSCSAPTAGRRQGATLLTAERSQFCAPSAMSSDRTVTTSPENSSYLQARLPTLGERCRQTLPCDPLASHRMLMYDDGSTFSSDQHLDVYHRAASGAHS